MAKQRLLVSFNLRHRNLLDLGEADTVCKQRIDQLLPSQGTAALKRATGKPRTRFMHCLPAFHNLAPRSAARCTNAMD